jgi:hypothetical protein
VGEAFPDFVIGGQMSQTWVWLIWTESGEYETYSRGLRGVFATEKLANEHVKQAGGEIEKWKLLTELPVGVTVYAYTDAVMADGTLSPDSRGHKRHGHLRAKWKSWSHEEPSSPVGEIVPWSNKGPDLYVKVQGTDRERVKALFDRLVAEARSRLGVEKVSLLEDTD